VVVVSWSPSFLCSSSEENWHIVFLYLCWISLLRSEFAFARQLNPWRGAWYRVCCRDCLVVVSRVTRSTFMLSWCRASIRTRMAISPCCVPRVAFAWSLALGCEVVVGYFGVGAVVVVGDVPGSGECQVSWVSFSVGSCMELSLLESFCDFF
jgi:hypothetical protein